MATRKTTTRRPAKKPAAPAKCPTCDGSGETTISVRVGRGRRITDDQQTALCPDCFGTCLSS
jgi:DnaJ-class molecular chaperone